MRSGIISNNMMCVRAALVISGLTLTLGSSLAHGNPLYDLAACDCDPSTYTLTVNTSGAGTATKLPDKQYYDKGEVVLVGFTPNEDKVFLFWTCNPPSHLASLSEDMEISVYVTGNTTLTALTRSKSETLYVGWNQNLGTVAMPPGGQGGNGSLTAPVDYGDRITLTATPNTGYYTVWVGQWNNGDWSGQRYGDSVEIKISGTHRLTADFRPMAEYPTAMNNLTVLTNGGAADVFCAGAPTQSYTAGPYLTASASGPFRFSMSIAAQKGYAYNYLTWVADGQTWYTTNGIMSYFLGREYTAQLVNKIMLNIATEGQGAVTSPDFVCQWNPKPYQSVTLGNSITPLVNANQVTMSPSACAGWAFDHWEYKNAQGEWVSTPGNPFQGGSLSIYMNWWSGSGIRVPDGETPFNVRAVFIEQGVDISLYSTQEGCFAGYAQRATGANVYSFTTGSDVITALINATSVHCSIGNLYIFSHAWLYNSQFGQEHSGGFFGTLDPPSSGFYGQKIVDDDPDARDLTDLQNAINTGTIRFANNGTLRVFLEGCRIGVTGSTIALPSSFVTQLGSITGRVVVSACAGSSEYALQTNSVKFRSAPVPYEELIDGIYDGWIEDSTQRGIYCTVPTFVFAN